MNNSFNNLNNNSRNNPPEIGNSNLIPGSVIDNNNTPLKTDDNPNNQFKETNYGMEMGVPSYNNPNYANPNPNMKEIKPKSNLGIVIFLSVIIIAALIVLILLLF